MRQQGPPQYDGSTNSAPPQVAASSEEIVWAVIAHLASFVGVLTIVGHVLVPLLILLVRGPSSAFVSHHAREALNYQISMSIYAALFFVGGFVLVFISAMLFMVETSMLLMIVGLPVLFGLIFFDLVVVVVGAAAAGRGSLYRYPLTIRFVR